MYLFVYLLSSVFFPQKSLMTKAAEKNKGLKF